MAPFRSLLRDVPETHLISALNGWAIRLRVRERYSELNDVCSPRLESEEDVDCVLLGWEAGGHKGDEDGFVLQRGETFSCEQMPLGDELSSQICAHLVGLCLKRGIDVICHGCMRQYGWCESSKSGSTIPTSLPESSRGRDALWSRPAIAHSTRQLGPERGSEVQPRPSRLTPHCPTST